MKRRSFLLGTSTLALGQILAGCQGAQAESLKIRILRNSIPTQLLNQFRQTLKQPARLEFSPEAQLNDLFTYLKNLQQSATGNNRNSWLQLPFAQQQPANIPNLVTLGDYWLREAIQEKLIQPLPLEKLSAWQQVPSQWQDVVRRNPQGEPDSIGQVWGAPYRWGSTVIAYRRDKFEALGWTPTDWQDLWREELRDRISLLDSDREVIGLTLKSLGQSYNTEQLDRVPNLRDRLLKLHQQVKLYSSDNYLQPLILGDTWLAVGSSTDILQAMRRNPQIVAVVPQSGTSLWADIWVQPAGVSTAQTSLAAQWINFCWQPQAARTISLFTRAISPVMVNTNPNSVPVELQENPVLLPPEQVLQNSEFLYPLTEVSQGQYRSLWQEIRRS